MTDYTDGRRNPIRPIRWRCPECGTSGDTEVRTHRRCTIVRRWCSDECRDASEVRQGLQREANKRVLTGLDFLRVQPVRALPLPPSGPPTWAITGDRLGTVDHVAAARSVGLDIDYGPLERQIAANMKGKL